MSEKSASAIQTNGRSVCLFPSMIAIPAETPARMNDPRNMNHMNRFMIFLSAAGAAQF
jgi:hypothetical protein